MAAKLIAKLPEEDLVEAKYMLVGESRNSFSTYGYSRHWAFFGFWLVRKEYDVPPLMSHRRTLFYL